jgi:putative endonuclease
MFFNKRRLSSDPKLLGRWGEKRCEKFLKKKGLKKLAHNFSCKAGEIDLIMVAPDRTIVFVEVRTRASRGQESFVPPESTITSAKKAKLRMTARYFLATHKVENRPFRFDIVTIVLGQKGREQINHYENAFVP